jgi:SHS2 domain-containing protein
MGKYSFIDHTADIGIEIEATGKAELFTLAARGMFAVICDVGTVEPVLERKVIVESNDLPGLLHEWLAELLYLYDVYFEIYNNFEFDFSRNGAKVKAVVRGEEADDKRHGVRGEIKNVTWCDYLVEETLDGGYFARVIFDL